MFKLDGLTVICPICKSDNIKKNSTEIQVSTRKEIQRFQCLEKSCGKRFNENTADFDIVEENVKLSKKVQKFQDTNRIERKSFREHARVQNALEEYNQKMIELLEKYSFGVSVPQITLTPDGAAGIFQIADLHLNELVDLPFNKFGFKVASQRLQMYVAEAKKFFFSFGVEKILVAFTGDMLNSDRRLDELLNQATNRTKATFLAVDLIKGVLLDLSQDFHVSCASVSGNESRVKDEFGFSDMLLSDNYDYTIYNILAMLFKGTEINFHHGNPAEQIINVGGKKILLIHGEQRIVQGNVERGIIQLCGKYSAQGQNIDFVIFGHLHYARIGDHFARSSSLVGANAYSDIGLQLISKASQNIQIITKAGQIHSVKIDLQDASRYEGYPYDETLEAYHSKSSEKNHQHKTIFEVVI